MKRIGIFGGSFNPPHYGHLLLAETCANKLNLDSVIFIPAYISPHKRSETNDVRARLDMIKLACNGNKRFDVSTVEIEKKGLSYTVETLEIYKRLYGGKSVFYLLMGEDSYMELDTWKDHKRLFSLAKIVVVRRPGSKKKKGFTNVRTIEMAPIGISSRQIRGMVRSQASIRYMVPEAVRGYILRHRLYARKTS